MRDDYYSAGMAMDKQINQTDFISPTRVVSIEKILDIILEKRQSTTQFFLTSL